MKLAAPAVCLAFVLVIATPPVSAQTTWSLDTDVGSTNLYGVSVLDASHAWAVGGVGAGGPGNIYRYDGATWSFETTIDTRHSAVWAVSPNDVWVASHNGAVYHYDGTWKQDTDLGIAFNSSIRGDSMGSTINVGTSNGTVYQKAGNWAVQTQLEAGLMVNGFDIKTGSGFWMVADSYGSHGVIFRNLGGWTVQTAIAGIDLYDLYVVFEDFYYGYVAAGKLSPATGYILFWNGVRWTTQTTVPDAIIRCVWGADSRHVWAGDNGGRIYFGDGDTWTLQTKTSSSMINDIWGTNSGLVWAVGNDGQIYRGLTPQRCNYHTDFDGDGTSEIALYRQSEGLWAIRDLTRAYFGSSVDTAVPADYDGDGACEIATQRGSSGLWAVRDLTRVYLGILLDQPLPGDYDGDGSADCCVFRPETGLWSIRNVTRFYFGGSGDRPAIGYYDGDNLLDAAVFKAGEGLWAVRGITRFYLGSSADNPVPGDYTGNSAWEGAIFRPADKLWSVRDLTRLYFGSGNVSSRPGDYDGNGRDDIAVYRFLDGQWAVRDLTRVYFGSSLDLPVTR